MANFVLNAQAREAAQQGKVRAAAFVTQLKSQQSSMVVVLSL